MPPAVEVDNIIHHYGTLVALDGVSFTIPEGRTFGLLGPNGSGKSTLFRILATLLRPTAGRAAIGGHDVVADRAAVRLHLGVLFQSPALDIHLTAAENLKHAGHLFGLSGADLRQRIDRSLKAMHVADRAHDRVKALSGGLRRRVELAQSLLHEPRILLLDEPTAGLDPRARKDLWQHLKSLQREAGMTILVTTHDMDEAEVCDELAIFDRGRLVVSGAPEALKQRVGGDCLTIVADGPDDLAAAIHRELNVDARLVDGVVRVEAVDGAALVGRLMSSLGDRVRSVTLGRPTLEDVFVRETGRRFDATGSASEREAAA